MQDSLLKLDGCLLFINLRRAKIELQLLAAEVKEFFLIISR